jgi:pimeloyl-ACP methyl ester carboxylesterase
MKTQTLTIANIHTTEAVAGEGLPVLLLHGWGANIELMWPLAERLVPLGYRVYIPDLPGFGGSHPPPSAWSVHEYADFVLHYLDSHGLDQVHLVGHSFGGRLGLILGAQHSIRLHKIVLIDSAGVPPRRSAGSGARLSTYKFIRDCLNKIGLKGLSEHLREWYNRRYGSSDFQSVQGVMRETFVKVVNEDLLPYAAKVKPSTLLLWGDQDEDTPLWQAKILEKTIPDAGLVVFEGAGHYSYLERPAEIARILDHFFKN